VRIRQRIRVKR